MRRKRALFLFLRYNVSGVTSFIFELALLYTFVHPLALPYYIAVPGAFFIATTLLYTICHWWVFGSSKRSVPFEYAYFLVILFSGMLWSLLIVTIIVQNFSLDPVVARIIASVFTGVWDFYLNARFNFRAHAFLRRR